MCFSAEASFTASLVLGAMGTVTLKNCAHRSQFFLAAVPFLFALQQFAEGVLWLELQQSQTPHNWVFFTAQHIFLFFAFIVWPIWIPLSLAPVEKITWRRNLILALMSGGVVLAGINLSYALPQNIQVQIHNHSIQYIGQAPDQVLLYPLIVLLPCFISSLKNMWIFGTLVGLGYVAAAYLYQTTFVSVWCFFAAIVSLIIYKIIKDNQEMPAKETSSN